MQEQWVLAFLPASTAKQTNSILRFSKAVVFNCDLWRKETEKEQKLLSF